MNFTCYIVDDEPDAIALLSDYVVQTPGLELIGSNQNPLIALDELTGKFAPDIAFIDVDMRQLSGLDLAGMVNLYTTVVFTTAYPEFALAAFEKEAFDYLLKPIDYGRFAKCIQKARRKINTRRSESRLAPDSFFNIKSEVKGRIVKIRFDDVMYIEGCSNYIRIHTREESHITYLTIKEIARRLPELLFMRIHRSFLVNLNFIKVIERARLKLHNGTSLDLGDQYKEKFLALMDERLIKKDRLP